MRCHGNTRISRPKVLCKLGSAYVNNTDISHMRRRGVATCEGRYCSNTKHGSGTSKCHRWPRPENAVGCSLAFFSSISLSCPIYRGTVCVGAASHTVLLANLRFLIKSSPARAHSLVLSPSFERVPHLSTGPPLCRYFSRAILTDRNVCTLLRING